MKKVLSVVLFFLLFATVVRSQQTEDDIFVGKSKTYGNFVGSGKQNGKSMIKGTVAKVEWCEEDCFIVWIKKEDGSIVSVNTKESGFAVPKNIIGKRIIVETVQPSTARPAKKIVRRKSETEISIFASGIQIFN